MALPASFVYCFRGARFRPFIKAGLSASWMISAKADLSRSYQNTGDLVFRTLSVKKMNVIDDRNRPNLMPMLGAGFRYKIKQSYFFVDVRYSAAILNQVKGSSRNNSHDDNIWKYYYIQDNMSLDNISINIGLSKIIYHPKRK